MDACDRSDLCRTESVKQYRHVDTSDELGSEVLTDHRHHRFLDRCVITACGRILAHHLLDHVATQVRGHHNHRVAEIDGTSLTIGQAAIVEHLQQDEIGRASCRERVCQYV